jgi:hypothetical protein
VKIAIDSKTLIGRGKVVAGLALAAAMFGAHSAQAQTATIYGQVGNFDVANNTGDNAHGFEIEIQGVDPAQIYAHFDYQRYGVGTVQAFPGGTYIRWTSAYDPATHTDGATTVPRPLGQDFGGTCYMGLPNYDAAGCEHFGVAVSLPATG